MKNQQKAIILLVIVSLVIIVVFLISGNSTDSSTNASNFDYNDFPLLQSLSRLSGPFTPELKKKEIFPGSLPGSFRILPSKNDNDFRKARFCIQPRIAGDQTGAVRIEYRALNAEEKFDDLKQQACTLSVNDTERFPACSEIIVLRRSGNLLIKQFRGTADVLLNGNNLISF